MTASVFGWLDQDDRDRLRMLEIVNLFREKSTRDEMGIEPIRDAFSDHFCPGTTWIQTRARYFLFVPWILRQIEREGVSSGQADQRARMLFAQLVKSLVAGGEKNGVIGSRAGDSLQRLPSGIYWIGMRQWGIRRDHHSIERYDQTLITSENSTRETRFAESGELTEVARRYWDPGMPAPPDDLFDRTTFTLTHEEAVFLRERIQESCAGSLLSGCFEPGISGIQQANFPWELRGLESLAPELQADIEHARQFALLSEGSAIFYNLMLAQLAVERGLDQHEPRISEYDELFRQWADEVAAEQDELGQWDRYEFWDRVRTLRPTLRAGAVRFFDSWMDLAIQDPHSISRSEEARNLISSREYLLKGKLARLHSLRALENWWGASGLGRLTYRWPVARRHLNDILNGLGRVEGAADA